MSPSRSAPVATCIRSIPSASNSASRMATPPGRTCARSGFSPSSDNRLTCPAERSALSSFLSPTGVMPVLRPPVGAQHLGRRAHGARRADRAAPAEVAEASLDGLQLGARGEHRLLHALLADLPLREEALGERDAAHVQAVRLEGLEPLAEDQLRAAAADVHDEPRLEVVGLAVRDAQVDQARLLPTGDDLDRVRRARAAPPRGRPPPSAPGAGCSCPRRARGRSGMCRMRCPNRSSASSARSRASSDSAPLLVESPGQLDGLPEAVDDHRLPVHDPGDQHVEAVRAQVHGGQVRLRPLLAVRGRDRIRVHCALPAGRPARPGS